MKYNIALTIFMMFNATQTVHGMMQCLQGASTCTTAQSITSSCPCSPGATVCCLITCALYCDMTQKVAEALKTSKKDDFFSSEPNNMKRPNSKLIQRPTSMGSIKR